VVRDPRDIIVSAYFSHLNSRPPDIWSKLSFFRPYLQSLSKEEGLMKEIEFMGPVMTQMLMWDYTRPSVLELRFEDVVRYPLPLFAEIFKRLSILPMKIAHEALPSIILKHGARPNGEDCASQAPPGQYGDWRNHFTRDHIAYFKSLYNPLLLKLGYEEIEGWH
jgi:hypothetical protein